MSTIDVEDMDNQELMEEYFKIKRELENRNIKINEV